MLAKRIRRREARAAKRGNGQAGGGHVLERDSGVDGGTEGDETRTDSVTHDANHPASDHTGDTVAAARGNLVQDGGPSITQTVTGNDQPVMSNIAAFPHSPIKQRTDSDHTALPLDLTSYRTHRSDTLEKHAAKIEQEQYEKARSEYLSRIPINQLTAEQKREKRTLTQRVRARERYRAKAAAKVGLKVEEHVMHMVDAPTADLRLLVLHERKRKRQSDARSAQDERQAKKTERYEEEEEEYERPLALPLESLSKEDRDSMVKLGSRIRSREWRRAQSAKVITAGLKRERTSEADPEDQVTKDVGRNVSPTTQESSTSDVAKDPRATPVESGQAQIGDPREDRAVPEPPVETPQTSEPVKRKRGRPPKKLDAAGSTDQTTMIVVATSEATEQRTRRANQYDESGIGRTRFAQELKTYQDAKASEFLSFCDLCDSELEEAFRLLLRVNVKAVGKLLRESRFAPQLYAFVQGRRLDLLDLPGIARFLR